MSTNVVDTDKRRIQRISLPLPSRVEVKINDQVSWNEVTRLTDISAFGAGFSLKRPLKRGRLVLLTVPMPRQLRCFDYSDAQYRVWSLVRRCIPVRNDKDEIRYSVGVAFTGKNPPSNYLDDPSTLYEITHREEEGLWHVAESDVTKADQAHLSKEERRQTRFFIPETVTLEVLDAEGNIVATAGWELGGPGPMIYVFSPSGSVLETHPVPCKRPTNCEFGGDDLTTLYVTTIEGFLLRARTGRVGHRRYC